MARNDSREDDRRDSRDARGRANERSNSGDRVAPEQLKSFVDRIERLEEDKKEIVDDIKEVYGEAKSSGFDVPVIRKLIAMRKKPSDERAEFEAILETYMSALGMA